MTDNPFSSKVFKDTWFNHFGKTNSRTQILGVNGVEFFKNPFKIYINGGKTHTKGIHYSLEEITEINGRAVFIQWLCIIKKRIVQ